MAPKQKQEGKPKKRGTWGGRREGAGRPKSPDSGVAHRPRAQFARRSPVHVTLEVVRKLAPLRRTKVAQVLHETLAAAPKGDGFAICHFSLQESEIHLVCEATSATRLSRGLQGWTIRFARQLNGKLGRSGRVFADRYDSVLLATPDKVRAALVQVLHNASLDGEGLDRRWRGIDPFTSAWYFDGWADDSWRKRAAQPEGTPPVAPARSQLLASDWKRQGLLRAGERPPATSDGR
jgi:hypothetical protein